MPVRGRAYSEIRCPINPWRRGRRKPGRRLVARAWFWLPGL